MSSPFQLVPPSAIHLVDFRVYLQIRRVTYSRLGSLSQHKATRHGAASWMCMPCWIAFTELEWPIPPTNRPICTFTETSRHIVRFAIVRAITVT